MGGGLHNPLAIGYSRKPPCTQSCCCPFVEFNWLSVVVQDNPSLRKRNQYMEDFEFAIECYINGDWVSAKEGLDKCHAKKENDGPVLKILEFMVGP